MSTSDTVTAAIIASSSALFGSLLGIGFTCAASVLGRKLEHSKLIAPWIARDELEKARIAAYRELWICLGGISTFHSSEMIAQNLATVQKQLQEWYYQRGGGLFIEGAANKSRSSKAAFFAARDLQSSDSSTIWETFHRLRASLRRDIGVFESDEDEARQLQRVRNKLGAKKT
jgi:hypothetical protein